MRTKHFVRIKFSEEQLNLFCAALEEVKNVSKTKAAQENLHWLPEILRGEKGGIEIDNMLVNYRKQHPNSNVVYVIE